jgi:flagellar protein FliO/FliZ
LNHRCVGYCARVSGVLALAVSPVWAAGGPSAVGAAAPPASALLFAAPVAHQALPGQAGSLLRVSVALLLVLAAVFAAAWFSRRMHGVGSARSAALEVIAQLPLGPRERAVLVRVGTQQVLLGVASGNVRALHVLPAAEIAAPDAAHASGPTDAAALSMASAPQPTFRSMLLKGLGK